MGHCGAAEEPSCSLVWPRRSRSQSLHCQPPCGGVVHLQLNHWKTRLHSRRLHTAKTLIHWKLMTDSHLTAHDVCKRFLKMSKTHFKLCFIASSIWKTSSEVWIYKLIISYKCHQFLILLGCYNNQLNYKVCWNKCIPANAKLCFQDVFMATLSRFIRRVMLHVLRERGLSSKYWKTLIYSDKACLIYSCIIEMFFKTVLKTLVCSSQCS